MADPLTHPEAPHTIRRCKNIVVCCDGTGNQFGPDNSNVVRLYTALCVDNDQVAYYHPGVGTMGAPNRQSRLGRNWSKLMGLAFAAGFRDNVLDAYRYLMETYDDGDHIFLFGFSRGAYTARALAGMIHGYGLLCRGNQGHIPYVWRDFTRQVADIHDKNAALPRNQKQTSIDTAEAFKHTFSHPDLKIHFVGLWDTVSSVGWITEPLELLHVATNPTMCIARHAVSLDERRCFYQDNLWGESLPDQDVLQVWFPGVHSDVGGSYANPESFLSNEALRWLLGEAAAAGLRVDPDRQSMVLGEAPESQHPAAPFYNPAPAPTLKCLPHPSLHGPWWLLEILPHRLYNKDLGEKRWRIPFGKARSLPDGSIVHSSVVERMKAFGYNPANLPEITLEPITTLPNTSARVNGFFRYRRPEPHPKQHGMQAPKTASRKAATASVAALALLGTGLLLVRSLLHSR